VRLVRTALLAAVCLALTASTASALDLETDVKPPPGEVGTPYEFEFEAEEGCLPYRFSYLNGTVPPGLRITQDGKLTGTPTEAGTFSFWVALDDNAGPSNPYCLIPSVQSQGEFTMIVLPDLAVTTKSLPIGVPRKPYSAQLEFSNPEFGWPVVWDITAGALAPGLTLSENGLLSGTPTSAGQWAVTVRAREPFRRYGEQELTLTVASALSATSALGPGEVGLRYAGKVTGSGGLPPLHYAVEGGALPAGLTLDATTGAVGGRPGEAGTFSLTFVVTDAAGQRTTVPSGLRIAERLAIATTRLPKARLGRPFQARLRTSGGVAPTRWRVARGTLPRGIRLDPRTGALAGSAQRTGVFRFQVEARDRLGVRSAKPLTLIVVG
jgi:hypothetical protein